MLVINPDECIDCGVCEPECPAEAILPDSTGDLDFWVDFNRKWSEQWPNISEKKDPPEDAEQWQGVPNKLEEHFSENPGEGD
tara:strand:+ start:531 stop:776 length:246 start_codon:yes stop_codon:yes gene_type:complete